MTSRKLLLSAAFCAAALLPVSATAQVRPTTFATLNGPIGVAVAADGSVFVTHDGIGDVRLVKFNLQGQPVRETAFGNLGSVGAIGKLAIDPGTGLVWDLLTNGEILQFDPNTLDGRSIGTLRSTPMDRGAVFDVSQGRQRDMSGEILPELSTYGDISLLRAGGVLNVFVTGRSSSGVPYVARATFNGNAFLGARAIAGASISSQEDNVARGVAVNGAGTVLTTLPTPDPRLNVQDRPYMFSATFPEAGAAPRLVLGGRDLASRGMAVNAAGHFYVTGFIGSTICGQGAAGAIIILTANGANGLCHPFSPTPVNMEDVAVAPQGAPNVFSTLRGYPGQVLSWGSLPLPAAVVGDIGPGPGDSRKANCSKAKKRVRGAKRHLRRLKKRGASARKIGKAKRQLRKAKRRRNRAC